MIEQFTEFFTYPFVYRALLGGVLVAALTSWMGVLVILRQSSFFGDAIAHSSLMGVAVGLLLGINPIIAAAIYAVIVAFGLPYLKKHSDLPIDSLLGFILPFSMGVGVILLALLPGYQPELVSFLFGSILAISWNDVFIVLVIVLVSFITMLILKQKMVFASFDSEYAKITGIQVTKIDVIYNVLLAVTIVAGIRLVGIVLVNALLVIPASTVRLYAKSLNQMFVFTPIVSVLSTFLGIYLSFVFDVPTGPAIATVSGLIFLVAVVTHKL
ncbi:metal ABC transporter permease [Candidatus Woesebacteria bacterium]|nr:MAG: metal ABC transporter permease [Candidatus Woesebacteria bacterium]